MKKTFYKAVVFLGIALATSAQADISINTSDIPLSVCAGQWGFLDASGFISNYEWGVKSFGLAYLNASRWAPNQAGIQIRTGFNGMLNSSARISITFF